MHIFFAIGLAQGLLLLLFLLLKKENKLANSILALLLLLLSFSLFLNFCYTSGAIYHFPHLIGLDNANPFLIPPIIFFYTKALTSKQFRFKSKDLIHLLPFLLYFIYVLLYFIIKDAAYKIEFLENLSQAKLPFDLLISSILKIIQAIIYLMVTYQLLIRHRQTIQDEFSYIERINLSWLKIITISITAIYTVRLFGILLPFFFTALTPGFIEGIMELVNVLFIYLMAYFAINQADVFKRRDPDSPESISKGTKPEVSPSTKTKYANSILSKEDSEHILKDLLAFMNNEKPYLKSGLTIGDVADEMNVTTKNLSQVINEHTQTNFFNFINRYRVEEVKSRLQDRNFDHYTILGIAMDSGFSSKSSFNTIFKKFTGTTPTTYKSSTS